MNVLNLRLQGARLLCRRPPPVEETATDGGVVIPSAWCEYADSPKDGSRVSFQMRRWNPLAECEVLAVGPGERDRNGVIAPCYCQPGDRVLFAGARCDSIDERHFIADEADALALVIRDKHGMRLAALNRCVLIERDRDELHSDLIEIPEAHRRRSWSGHVLSVGQGTYAVERDSQGDTWDRGARRLLLRDGRPYREPCDARPGDRVHTAAYPRHVEAEVGGRDLVLLCDWQDVQAYERATAA